MYSIKYIFLILIFASSTSIGFLFSKRYSDRLKELNLLASLINILQNKIKFTRMPMQEILQELSHIKENQEISGLFYEISKKIQIKKMEEAWNESVDEKAKSLNLKKNDINLIKSLGNTLGKTDVEGQMSGIDQFNNLLKIQIKEAELEKSKNEKMYKSLGAIIGLVLVIILV